MDIEKMISIYTSDPGSHYKRENKNKNNEKKKNHCRNRRNEIVTSYLPNCVRDYSID